MNEDARVTPLPSVSGEALQCLLRSLALALRNTRHDYEGTDSALQVVESLERKIEIVAHQRAHFGFSDDDLQSLRWAVEALRHWVTSAEEALADPSEGPPH